MISAPRQELRLTFWVSTNSPVAVEMISASKPIVPLNKKTRMKRNNNTIIDSFL